MRRSRLVLTATVLAKLWDLLAQLNAVATARSGAPDNAKARDGARMRS